MQRIQDDRASNAEHFAVGGIQRCGGRRRDVPGLLRTFGQGVLTNVLNPKVLLFFLAFLPQFIDPASSSKVGSMLFLGALFTFNGTLWCLALVVFAAAISRRVRGSAAAARRMKKLVGAVFVGLGVRLAVSR